MVLYNWADKVSSPDPAKPLEVGLSEVARLYTQMSVWIFQVMPQYLARRIRVDWYNYGKRWNSTTAFKRWDSTKAFRDYIFALLYGNRGPGIQTDFIYKKELESYDFDLCLKLLQALPRTLDGVTYYSASEQLSDQATKDFYAELKDFRNTLAHTSPRFEDVVAQYQTFHDLATRFSAILPTPDLIGEYEAEFATWTALMDDNPPVLDRAEWTGLTGEDPFPP